MMEMAITSSVLILAILLLRRVTRGRISMRFRYALWLAVALRLVLPVSVADSALSVMNLVPESVMTAGEGFLVRLTKGEGKLWQTIGDMSQSAQADLNEAADKNATAGEASGKLNDWGRKYGETGTLSGEMAGQEQKTGQDSVSTQINAGLEPAGNWMSSEPAGAIPGILRGVWMFGVLLVGAYMIIGWVRFRRILYRCRRIVSEKAIPKELADRLAGRRMRVYQVEGLASPCLVGRNVYVDTKLVKERRKFTHVLAHEYCHAAQMDTLWALLRSALAAVYWFHPLVWAAAFAARQDSELACDEAVIRLLGEQERFAYGRTLLYMLSGGHGQIDCAGTALTMEGQKRGVKERVHMIAGNTERKGWTAAVVIMMMLLVCGCAFTGSEQEKDVSQGVREQASQEERSAETVNVQADRRQEVGDISDKEFERIRKEYEDARNALDAQEQTLGQIEQEAAFLSALNYRGVMAGKDDSELVLDRELDYQAYYEYVYGKQDGQKEEQNNPPENGWYLICRNEEAQISLYGLYTQEFGPRGIKTLIGEDVNTYDIAWYPSGMNGDRANIRVLEGAQDGFPRRFVFKILAENTSDREIWKLYSGFRYDTGTVQMEELTAQMYRDWVDRNLSFMVSESGDEVLITYEGDMVLAPLDISAYQDQKVEEVTVSPDVADFQLDSDIYAGEVHGGQGGYEGVVLNLAVGLKLDGIDGVWFDGLRPLTIQVLCHPEQEPAFALQHPQINEQDILRSLSQERQMEEIRSGNGSDMEVE